MINLSQDKIDLLLKPLPKESISQHPTKKFLSTIKAIYVVERLNDVFGIGAWKTKSEFIERVEKMVVVKSTFYCGDIEVEAFGGNDNADLGDAYKGAATDALTKIGSYLGIGMDVFKGLADKEPVNEVKSINPIKSNDKEEIAILLQSKSKEQLVSGSDYKEFCFDYTGFPLEAEFYRDILASLK